MINIKIAKPYRTVSSEALCVITGLIPINIKIEEATKLHEMIKAEGTMYEGAMDIRNWVQPSKHITIIEVQEENTHFLQVYTDGSKNEEGVDSGIAVFAGTNLITTQMYRLNGRCTKNRAEQLAILKALECIHNQKDAGKTIIVYTENRITLQLLTNHKTHTYLIDKIRIKVMEIERNEWKIEFSWIKAHTGKKGNELADLLAKEASNNNNIKECYNRILKSTKSFYPNIEQRMMLKVTTTTNFTTILTGHGNKGSYLQKFNIMENPVCPCNKGDQTVDHIIYSCALHEKERNRLKAAIHRPENGQ